MKKWTPKPKQSKANWTTAFPDQLRALRPETSKSGGARWRSKPQAVMLEVYNGIAELFKTAHPLCQCCMFRVNVNQVKPNWTDDIHHKAGREGLLLFDVRNWAAVCRTCHTWIQDNPEAARQVGMLAPKNKFNSVK